MAKPKAYYKKRVVVGSPTGEQALDPLFTYPDPRIEASRIVDEWRNRQPPGVSVNITHLNELKSQIVAAVEAAVAAATGLSEAYRSVRGRSKAEAKVAHPVLRPVRRRNLKRKPV